MKSKFLIDRVFLGALTVFFAVMLQQSTGMSRTASQMPRLFCIAGIFLCFFVLVKGIIAERKAAAKKASGGEEKKKEGDWRDAAQGEKGMSFLLTFGIVAGYIVLIYLFGFIVSSVLVMILVPFFMKYQKRLTSVIVAVVSTFSLFFAFRYLFHITLPTGLLFNALF